MLSVTRRQAVSVATAAGLVLSVLVIWLVVASRGESQPEPADVLRSVDNRTLRNAGISLELPGVGQAVTLDAETAQVIALRSTPGAKVKERALLLVRDVEAVPTWECVCWVYALDQVPVQGGPPGRPRPPLGPTFWLVFVDSKTGEDRAVMGTIDPR